MITLAQLLAATAAFAGFAFWAAPEKAVFSTVCFGTFLWGAIMLSPGRSLVGLFRGVRLTMIYTGVVLAMMIILLGRDTFLDRVLAGITLLAFFIFGSSLLAWMHERRKHKAR